MLKLAATYVGLILLAGCASGYKPESASGGFSDLKVGEGLYEVRYQGNGFTRRSEASQLLMRRCAELVLEQGHRYFATVGSVEDSAVGSAGDPGTQVRIRLLADEGDDTAPMDAVTIVEQTEELARGKLSAKARAELARRAPP